MSTESSVAVTLFGIDISNNNGADLSMAEVQAEGFSWVEAKVSEGNYFQDSTWSTYSSAAQSAGLPVIGYHYANSSCTPASQAQCFASNNGGDLVMIDFESNSGTIDDYWALVDAFNAIGVTVTLTYLPQWYWEQIGSPDLSEVPGLIASAYPGGDGYASDIYTSVGGDNGEGWASYGGATPAIWQFTDSASIDGNTLDANAFRGTIGELNDLLQGETVADSDTILAYLQDIRAQLTGSPNLGEFPGWAQNGGRTLNDVAAAAAAKEGVSGTSDTKAST